MNPWQTHAPKLAAVAMPMLVNRHDAWLAYMPLEKRGVVVNGRKLPEKTYSAPNRTLIGKVILTESRLACHFAATREDALIGLYAISVENTSRWCLWDFDNHRRDGTGSRNLDAAIFYYDKLTSLGFSPILLESDDAGGFHLWCIFAEPIASDVAHYFGRWLVADFESVGLTERPESFPKQPRLTPAMKFGNAARLWGRHHTRAYWPKVFDGLSWVDGYGAIAVLLSATGGDGSLIPSEAAPPPPPAPRPKPVRISQVPADRRLKRCSDYVAKIDPSITNSLGHDQLLAAARATWFFGLHKADAMIVLREFNLRCQPEWTEQELEYKYGQVETRWGAAYFGCKLRTNRPTTHQHAKSTTSRSFRFDPNQTPSPWVSGTYPIAFAMKGHQPNA